MSGESVITTALRKSTNAWKVVIGTGTDYSATMDGIIGMMFNASYADATLGFASSGLLQANVHPWITAPRDALAKPEAWITAWEEKAHHEEVAATPRIISDLTVVARFRTVTADSSDAGPNISNYDLEYLRSKYCDLVRDASKPAKTASNFGLTTGVYMVQTAFEMDEPGFQSSQGGYAVQGMVKHHVSMIRS
jgi:hypothetical protein